MIKWSHSSFHTAGSHKTAVISFMTEQPNKQKENV